MDNQSLNSHSRDSPDWGSMGGNSGDGLAGSAMGNPPQGVIVPSTPPPQPPSYDGGGGITRFATPELVQQQLQQQQQAVSYASPQAAAGMQSIPMQGSSNYGGIKSPPPGSFAARSQQAYQQQQQQQHQQYAPNQTYAAANPSPQYTLVANPSSATAYAARSQASYQQPPQQAMAYGNQQPTATAAYAGPPPQQQSAAQYQQPQTILPQQTAPAPSTSGSFAARSAQAYAQQQQAYATPQQQHAAPTPYNTPNVYTPASTTTPQYQQQQQSNVYSPAALTNQSNVYAPPQQPGLLSPRPEQVLQQQQQIASPYAQQPQPPVSHVVSSSSDNYSTVSSMHSVAHSTLLQQHDPHQAHQQLQQKLLTDATRKLQEHAYYMKQAMEQTNLPIALDRAAHMVGELGGPPHGPHHHHVGSNGNGGPANTGNAAKLDPKHYYELYMRVLDELPAFEEYLLGLAKQAGAPDSIQIVDTTQTTVVRTAPYTMKELYDCTQYCPRVMSRLYLQIAAGSALIRSGEVCAKWVLHDLQQVVRCEQNPIRGLFLRHYLLTALRDKLPDTPAPMAGASHLETIIDDEELEGQIENEVISETDPGNVKDSYEFILDNLKEMNKLWVRIQHLPGEGRNKDVRKRRERERNDLRMIVGTNLVRLSQLKCVTSKIYGEYILPQILDHIVVYGDPLSQAYMMDCLVQVFPDEYHIETMPILLSVCPRLRDKVNIRTILQGLMDRLANYLAEEELLDETDTNQVKRALARDSFTLFEECISKVYNSRGPKLTSMEVLRLQAGLLQYSLRCFPGNMEQIAHGLAGCVRGLRQANASYDIPDGTMAHVPEGALVIKNMDLMSIIELEKMLSIPLESLGLRVLELDPYSDLAAFLPWLNRRQLALNMLDAVTKRGSAPKTVDEIEKLFKVIEPVLMDQTVALTGTPTTSHSMENATRLMAGLGVNTNLSETYPATSIDSNTNSESAGVSRLIHLLYHDETDTQFEMLRVAQKHLCKGGPQRNWQSLVAVAFVSVRLAERVFNLEQGARSATMPVDDQEHKLTSTDEQATVTVEAPEQELSSNNQQGILQDESEVASLEVSKTDEQAPEKEALEVSGASKSKIDNSQEEEVAQNDARTMRSITCRNIFVFIQETIDMIAKANAEAALKLFLEMALAADGLLARTMSATNTIDYSFIAYEFLTQAFSQYEDSISDGKAQHRCIKLMIGTLLASRRFSKDEYERLITKVAQYSAKLLKKNDQCELVAQCALLFYSTDDEKRQVYSNPQRALECLQRALKLADACTSANPANAFLFIELLETYIFFFEHKNPSISAAYITGLVALVKEHTVNSQDDSRAMAEVKSHFNEVIQFIKMKKEDELTAELFASVLIE
ncbi:hypothetical protein MPSEU_001020700 [Mayamaea pseudoterrestris]|nr:hypothetical protein MPSEU_001020700 [Mayamaea pseudoterrestris]